MSSDGQFSIGEVARRAGLRASAIRFYERGGLIRAPRRVGGRRIYDASVFESLALVQLAQDAGFAIREIKQLVNGFDRATPASARWRSFALRKREEITAHIERAERTRALVERLLACRCETLSQCVRGRALALARGS